MDAFAPDTVLAKRPDNVQSVVDDEIVLLDLGSGQFFSLSGTGRRVWELLDNHAAMGSLVGALLDEYEIDEPTCAREVSALLRQLETRQLVTIGG
ncbi:MAG: PqqD family protein [Sphingomonadales bacterium]|nr:PqqD family protein [Sphingomonadales bacterium]MBD3772880.1 PqqD family protein [Paracoccaceae bacterium]